MDAGNHSGYLLLPRGMLETTLDVNYSTEGMLETTQDAKYSHGGVLETTQYAKCATEGMLKPLRMLLLHWRDARNLFKC